MRDAQVTGSVLFARYAYAPNELGYCGPANDGAVFEYGITGDGSHGELPKEFTGAWPYLQLIAAATGLDPFSREVVEAYWIGAPLLEGISVRALDGALDQRLRALVVGQLGIASRGAELGGVPHHSFHVFCVYPWAGLLPPVAGPSPALNVLDRCRIRWGHVLDVADGKVSVESEPLTWDGRKLALGTPVTEVATYAVDGRGFRTDLAPGDWVALHWDWVCERLSTDQLRALREYSARNLAIVNASL